MTIPIIGQTKQQINIEALDVILCPVCKYQYFTTVQKMRILPAEKSRSKQNELIGQPALKCNRCGFILDMNEDENNKKSASNSPDRGNY